MDEVDGARTFGVAGSAYDSFMGRYSMAMADQFADAAGVQPGQTAVDVGCGPGALTGVLVERLGAGAVAACDPSPGFLADCEARHPGIECKPGPAESIPFETGRFDPRDGATRAALRLRTRAGRPRDGASRATRRRCLGVRLGLRGRHGDAAWLLGCSARGRSGRTGRGTHVAVRSTRGDRRPVRVGGHVRHRGVDASGVVDVHVVRRAVGRLPRRRRAGRRVLCRTGGRGPGSPAAPSCFAGSDRPVARSPSAQSHAAQWLACRGERRRSRGQ